MTPKTPKKFSEFSKCVSEDVSQSKRRKKTQLLYSHDMVSALIYTRACARGVSFRSRQKAAFGRWSQVSQCDIWQIDARTS